MIVSVFGASGRLGHAFITEATAAGHTLRLHYRAKPSEVVPTSSTVVVGSLSDPAAVREVLRGADAAVVLFGHKKDARVPYCAAAMKVIIATMKTLEQSRLLVVTGCMIGEQPSNVGLPMKLLTMWVKRSMPEAMLDDREQQEQLVRSSHLSGWTVVKPPRLTDGAASTGARAEPALPIGLGSKVSRASLARVMVGALQQSQFLQQAVYVADA
jgi:putative NADH-flavin reductase